MGLESRGVCKVQMVRVIWAGGVGFLLHVQQGDDWRLSKGYFEVKHGYDIN